MKYKSLLLTSTLIAGTLAAVTGCSSGSQTTTTTTSPSDSVSSGNPSGSKAASNDVVIITEPASNPMTSLDPSQWAAQILVDQGTLLEGLYGYNEKNEVVPKIATGYKISNNGRTWTFTLRKDERWSNGDPVTAHDFYYAWMRQLSPSDTNAQLWLSVLNNVENAYAYHGGSVPASKVGIKVIDDYTLQITTTTPHDILGELVLAGSMPLSKKAVEAHPTDWYMPKNFIGDGPYIVKSFTPNGELQMVRNPTYVGLHQTVDRTTTETL